MPLTRSRLSLFVGIFFLLIVLAFATWMATPVRENQQPLNGISDPHRIPLPFMRSHSSLRAWVEWNRRLSNGLDLYTVHLSGKTQEDTQQRLDTNKVYLVQTANEAGIETVPLDAVIKDIYGHPADYFGYKYSSATGLQEVLNQNSPSFYVRWPGTFFASAQARARDGLHGNAIANFESQNSILFQKTDASDGAVKFSGNALYVIIANDDPADIISLHPAVVCGDGWKTTTEACDDGNTANGDGCSATCTIEDAFNCTGNPSVCSRIPSTAMRLSCAPFSTLSQAIIDNAATIGYTETGSWTTRTSAGFGGSARRSVMTDSGAALWCATSLPQGQYQVRVTWPETVTASTQALFSVYDGSLSSLVASKVVNQRITATGSQAGWQSLGTVVLHGTGIVMLPKASDSDVIADAVWFARVGSGTCTQQECGPTMGVPNTQCGDGSVGGPVCARHADGTCGYTLRQCPNQVCGNGVREAGEQCDDGNIVSGDGCSTTCQQEENYECNTSTPNQCMCVLPPPPCVPPPPGCHREGAGVGCPISCGTLVCGGTCGNGTIETGEECDLGAKNGQSDSFCDATCHITPLPFSGNETQRPEIQVRLGTGVILNETTVVTIGTNVISASGATEPMKTVTIRNTGTAPLTLSGMLAVPNVFRLVAPLPKNTLAPGEETNMNIRFAGTQPPSYEGSVRFFTNDMRNAIFIIKVVGFVLSSLQ